MKQKKPFKVGATYQLKKKYIEEFHRPTEIHNLYGDGVFQFVVGHIREGNIVSRVYTKEHGVHVAYTPERYMFKRIDNK